MICERKTKVTGIIRDVRESGCEGENVRERERGHAKEEKHKYK